LAALTQVTILALVHVALAQAQVATPSWTAATALSTLHANGKIAFVVYKYDGHERSGISVMNPDGSGRAELTSTQILCPQPNNPSGSCGPDQLDSSPSWSPDGKQIAFIRRLPPNFWYADVFVMNADGSNQRRLTQNGRVVHYSTVTWSPDGTKLAFVGPPVVGDIYIQIYVINADGSNQQPIGRGENPAWSPDGSKLAFPYSSTSDQGLYVMNPDGSGRTQITATKPGPGLFDADWNTAWSPDSTRILFIRSVGCNWDDGSCESSTIWTINADGSNPAKLADIPFDGATDNLAWSPDGTKIVFRWLGVGGDDRNGDLFTMDTDGRNITRLTNTPGEYESMPSWQSVALAPPDNNPIDDAQFLVRQHYRDFLNREPDDGGLAYWTNEITKCGSDARCVHERRIGVSASFFVEQEFQDTGYFVDRFYKASFGRQPTYAEFTADRANLIGGPNLEANKQAFADDWVQRAAFLAAYPNTMSNTEVVNKLFDSAGLTASRFDAQRQQEIAAMNSGRSRALVLRDVIEIGDFKNISDTNDPRYSELKQISQYNPAFVLMQYFGYLRRDKDQNGYDFWLDVVNNREPNNYRGMVCSFLTSSEYQLRFGSSVTRSNADCGP
jgi:dipeptidyl aminopeptidase/acylaminoacyl peptidase